MSAEHAAEQHGQARRRRGWQRWRNRWRRQSRPGSRSVDAQGLGEHGAGAQEAWRDEQRTQGSGADSEEEDSTGDGTTDSDESDSELKAEEQQQEEARRSAVARGTGSLVQPRPAVGGYDDAEQVEGNVERQLGSERQIKDRGRDGEIGPPDLEQQLETTERAGKYEDSTYSVEIFNLRQESDESAESCADDEEPEATSDARSNGVGDDEGEPGTASGTGGGAARGPRLSEELMGAMLRMRIRSEILDKAELRHGEDSEHMEVVGARLVLEESLEEVERVRAKEAAAKP